MTKWKYVYSSIKPNSVVVRTNDNGCCESLSCESEEFKEWLEDGNTPDPADPPPPAPTVYKEKNSITVQLIQAGKMTQIRAILNMPENEDNKDLWNGAYKIAYDDQAVRGMIAAVGLDAETVMSNAANWDG